MPHGKFRAFVFFKIPWGKGGGGGTWEWGMGDLGAYRLIFLNPLRISCTIQCFFSVMSEVFLTCIVGHFSLSFGVRAVLS